MSERWIPEGSTEVRQDGVDGVVVYLYTSFQSIPMSGPCAVGYIGKQSKPALHERYRNEERRTACVASFFDGQRKRQEMKADRKAERQDFITSLNVGDILDYTWGYDQTNAEFYQVVEVKPSRKQIIMREIASHLVKDDVPGGAMSGNRLPIFGQFVSDAPLLVKRIQPLDSGRECVRMEHGIASLWNGKPVYCSWYH